MIFFYKNIKAIFLRIFNKASILILLMVLLSSCHTNKLEHPNFDQLPKGNDLNYSLDLNEQSTTSTTDLLNLKDIEFKSKIKKDTLDINLFGIKNLRLGPKGNIYFTQAENNSIYVYDKNGKFKYTIGQSGNGPGEFTNISAFDFSNSFDTLYIQDENEIEVYLYAQNSYQYNSTIFPEVYRLRGICVLDNMLYYSGFRYEKLDTPNDSTIYNTRKLTAGPINQYDLNKAAHAAYFGPIYNSYSGWWLLDSQLSSMKLHCNKKTNTVIGIQENFGYFYGYNKNGSLKWVSKLDNFKYATLIERNINSPQISYSASPGAKISPSRNTNTKYSVFHVLNEGPYPVEIIVDSQNGKIYNGGKTYSTLFAAMKDSIFTNIYIDWNSLDKSSEISVYEIN